MGTVFLSITQAEIDSAQALALVAREREMLAYETNISSYTAMLAAGGISKEFQTRLNELLVTENREYEKTKAIYAAVKASIPAAQLVALVGAAKAKMPPIGG